MAVPSTSTYNPNRARVVQLALTTVGAIGPGTVSPAQDAAPLVAHANDVLNILLKSMDADGVLTWRVQRRTFTTIAGQASYVISSDVGDVEPPSDYVVSGQTTRSQIQACSRDDYMVLGDRTLTGIPILQFVEKSLDVNGLQFCTVTLYPVPANTGDTVEYQAVVKARDQNTDADTLDITQLWIRCLVFGLSLDLAMPYGLAMDRISFLQTSFENERQRCLEQDGERGNVQLVPFGQSCYGGSYYGQGGGRY